jgi:hypothetical protein
LPVIATIGLSFAAPGIASAMGFVKPLSSLTGVTGSTVFGKTLVNAVGRAAIAAATGGNLSSIVAAGITPFVNSSIFQDALGGLGGGTVGSSLNKITNFIKTPLTEVFGETFGNIFTGALGDSSVAGLVAAVTGQDIVKAMGSEFATSAVSATLARSWNTLKTEVPRLLQTEADIEQKALDAKIKKGFPNIEKINNGFSDKITFFSHQENFTIDDKPFHLVSQFRYIHGGCILVPNNEKINKLIFVFNNFIRENLKKGYVGSEEKYLDFCYLENKDEYNIIKSDWRQYFDIFG